MSMGNSYSMPNSSYFQDISLGKIPGHSIIYKFGRNPAVGATEVIVAAGGFYGLPTIAQTVTITSSDVEDAFPSGDGARTVRIYGLDTNYDMIEETVNMGGTSIGEYIRVYRAVVETSGSTHPTTGGNLGIITIEQSVSGIEMILIPIKASQTQAACFTIPAGYIGLVWNADTTTGEGKDSVNSFKVRCIECPDEPFKTASIRDNFQNVVGSQNLIPPSFPEKTDIVFTSISSASGTAVSATFLIELINMDNL